MLNNNFVDTNVGLLEVTEKSSIALSSKASAFAIDAIISSRKRTLPQEDEINLNRKAEDIEINGLREPSSSQKRKYKEALSSCHKKTQIPNEENPEIKTAAPIYLFPNRLQIHSTTNSVSRCHLQSQDLWRKFSELGTEMIITKTGRRMFPVIRISFSNLDPTASYLLLMELEPVDERRYRYVYHRSNWLVASKTLSSDPTVPDKKRPQQRCENASPSASAAAPDRSSSITHRLALHPDSPFTGSQLMRQMVSFDRVKLTNNLNESKGYIILNSMHKYQPKIHLIQSNNLELLQHLLCPINAPTRSQVADSSKSQNKSTPSMPIGHPLNSFPKDSVSTFVFPETVFIAVTAYQNQLITKLKIDSNPFAKGFRDSSRLTDIERDSVEFVMGYHSRLHHSNCSKLALSSNPETRTSPTLIKPTPNRIIQPASLQHLPLSNPILPDAQQSNYFINELLFSANRKLFPLLSIPGSISSPLLSNQNLASFAKTFINDSHNAGCETNYLNSNVWFNFLPLLQQSGQVSTL